MPHHGSRVSYGLAKDLLYEDYSHICGNQQLPCRMHVAG